VDDASTARTNDGRRGDCEDGWRCRGGQCGVHSGVETLHGGGGVYERGRRSGEGAQDGAGDGWGADGNDANRGRDEERRKKGRRRGGHLYPTSFVLVHRWPRYKCPHLYLALPARVQMFFSFRAIMESTFELGQDPCSLVFLLIFFTYPKLVIYLL
jgi:hypothetical protein